MPNRTLDLRRAHALYTFVENGGRCVYCGAEATSRDHFTPISFTSRLLGIITSDLHSVLLPACLECNLIAGSRVFRTVNAKRQYIQQRLMSKYKHLLKIPQWYVEELEGMSPSMKEYIRVGIVQSNILKRRLKWRNEKNPSDVSNVVNNLLPPGAGEGSAGQSASNAGTTNSDRNCLSVLRRLNIQLTKTNIEFGKLLIEEYGLQEAEVMLRQLPKPRTW